MENQVEQLALATVEELGAVVTDRGRAVQVVRKALAKTTAAATKAAAKSPVNPGKAKFLARVDELEPNEKKALEDSQRSWDFFSYFRRAQVTGGDQIIWDNTNDQVTGVSNLDNNELPAGTNMLIEYVSMRYGYDPTGTVLVPTTIPFRNYGEFPALIQNAEVTITLGGRKIAERIPVVNFLSIGASASQSRIDIGDTSYDLRKDIAMWRSKDKIEVMFHMPAGTLPSGNHFIELMAHGQGIRNRY